MRVDHHGRRLHALPRAPLAFRRELALAAGDDVALQRGERLRDAAAMIGITRVATEAGVPYTTLRGYMAGGDMKLSAIAALAKVCGVTIDWIAYGNEMAAAPDGSRIARSSGAPDGVSTSAQFRSDLIDVRALGRELRIPVDELKVFHGRGDAMDPTVRDGDLLVARGRDHAVIAPGIYAIEVESELVARRLEQRVDGALVVSTDNPRYEPEVLGPAQDRPFRVFGPVVWLGGPLRG